MTCLADGVRLSFVSNHQKAAPGGVLGGQEHSCGSIEIKRAGKQTFQDFTVDSNEISPSRFGNGFIGIGDTVRVCTPGGGGYGYPDSRDVQAVAEDVREGRVSPRAAKVDCGVKSGDFE